ncbi:MAG: hypothetical protein KBC67_00490 [Candidatus Pacebacteria bacterium]|nr:hypothetical protein [Candidatus Paceibacterota bacterium]
MQELTWIMPASHKERSVDWFWAIGIITLVGAGTAFFVNNALFGIFILLGGGLLFYTNLNKPNDTSIHINEKEITVSGLSYKTNKMKGFAVVKNAKDQNLLIVRTDRFFLPILIIHVADHVSVEQLEDMLEKRIPKEDLREPPANAVAEKLGF